MNTKLVAVNNPEPASSRAEPGKPTRRCSDGMCVESLRFPIQNVQADKRTLTLLLSCVLLNHTYNGGTEQVYI